MSWRALLQKRIGKVVNLSSVAVYGIPEYVPTDEEHPLKPVSPYGAQKQRETIGLTCERLWRRFRCWKALQPVWSASAGMQCLTLNKIHHDPTH